MVVGRGGVLLFMLVFAVMVSLCEAVACAACGVCWGAAIAVLAGELAGEGNLSSIRNT